jgi:hypothetical protein
MSPDLLATLRHHYEHVDEEKTADGGRPTKPKRPRDSRQIDGK